MRIKVSLGKLSESKEMLEFLGKEKFSALVAFKIMGIIKAINPHLQSLEELYRSLIFKYGAPVEGTDKTQVTEENIPAFQKELLELYAHNVEIEFDALSLSELTIPISSFDMLKIDFIFLK